MAQAVSISSISADALKSIGSPRIPVRIGEIKPRRWAADAATVERIHGLGHDIVDFLDIRTDLPPAEQQRRIGQFLEEAEAIIDRLDNYGDRRRMIEAVRMRLMACYNCFHRQSPEMLVRSLTDAALYLRPLPASEA